MPDGGGFQVDLAALERHEQELRLLLDGMPSATAELSNQWRPDVYGLVGQLFASVLDLWNNDAGLFVENAHGAGNYLADQLKAVHDEYVAGDTRVTQGIKEIHTTLDEHVAPAGGQESKS